MVRAPGMDTMLPQHDVQRNPGAEDWYQIALINCHKLVGDAQKALHRFDDARESFETATNLFHVLPRSEEKSHLFLSASMGPDLHISLSQILLSLASISTVQVPANTDQG